MFLQELFTGKPAKHAFGGVESACFAGLTADALERSVKRVWNDQHHYCVRCASWRDREITLTFLQYERTLAYCSDVSIVWTPCEALVDNTPT